MLLCRYEYNSTQAAKWSLNLFSVLGHNKKTNMSLGPFLRSPFTDLTGCLINHQSYDKCGKMEMDMMDCLEAYGVERGKKMCADIIADFNECSLMTKQMKRFYAMRTERIKQYLKGERKREELYAEPPRVDAY